MEKDQIPISDSTKIILNTIKDELFPVTIKLKNLVIRIQKCRIFYQIYSKQLTSLEKEYYQIVSDFFIVDTKLKTPDILFNKLPKKGSENMVAYFQYQGAFLQNLSEASNYVEIIDRTLDRKNQTIQNNRTFILATIAIIISILSTF